MKVPGAAWWIMLSLWSFGAKLWESIQFSLHCVTLVRVMHRKDCPKKSNRGWIWLFFGFSCWGLDGWEAWNITSHVSSMIFFVWYKCLKWRQNITYQEMKQCSVRITQHRNLKSEQISNTYCQTVLRYSVSVHLMRLCLQLLHPQNVMWRLSLQTENCRSRF